MESIYFFRRKSGLSRLFVLLILAMTAITVKATDRVIGYCPDEITSNVYPVGVSGQKVFLSAAVKFPSSMMLSMKGNKLTKIRIGIGSGMTSVYVWVRVGSLTATPVLLQSVSSVTEGWNEITLDTPYEIDGSDIYVGYSGTQPSDKLCVWLDGDEDENATFIYDGSWIDYYGYGWGSLLIQGVVTGDNFLDEDLCVERLALDSAYYRSGTTAKADITFVNQGENAVNGFSYSVQVDDLTPSTGTVSTALQSTEKAKVSESINLTDLSEGEHKLRVYINRAEDSSDGAAQNDTISKPLYVYTTSYKHNILLEHFTGISCVNCPLGDNTLIAATKNRNDVVWVSHHVGYKADELTVSDSYKYTVFGVKGAPYAMLDRMILSASSSYPAFSIGYTNASQGGAIVASAMDYVASKPSFVKVDVSCDYEESSRSLTVKVTGESNSIFSSLTPDTRLSIFLTENNVVAKTVQSGTVNDTTHNHVLRSVLTDPYGDVITWNGNTFETSKTVTLSEKWKPENINAIVFISKPYSSGNVNDAYVLNTGIANIEDITAIKDVTADRISISIKNGRIVTDGSFDVINVYKADGTEAGTTGLQRGMYIIKARKGNTVNTKKIIY